LAIGDWRLAIEKVVFEFPALSIGPPRRVNREAEVRNVEKESEIWNLESEVRSETLGLQRSARMPLCRN
jgi:hypothetical protein